MFADTAKLAVNLSLEGNFTSGLQHAESSLSHFNSSVSKTISKVGNDLGRGIRNTAQNLERLAFVAGGAVVAGIGAAVKVAGDFEAQMNTIATIVDRQDIPAIGEQLRKTARDTGVALDDLTAGYYDLASAGVKGALATSVLNDAVKLGIGGLATTAQTIDLLTTAVNAYGLDAAGAEKATNQFALAIADGKVKADQIAASFADVASIAKAYGVGIDQIAASYAFLTAQGVPATEVTTELQRAIVSLINPTAELKAAQKALGVSFGEQLKSGKSVAQVMQEIADYSAKTGIPLNQLLGRVEAVKYALQTTGPQAAGFAAELKKMGVVGDVAAQQMAERQQGLNYQLNRLKANVKDAGITIGTELIPQLANLSGELATFLASHQAEIKNFARGLSDGVHSAIAFAKSLDWAAIGTGLKTAAFWAKTLIQGFMALPPEVKETLAGLYALNKLSGGAVVNIGIDITKGLAGGVFGQFFARGAPGNPMYVVPVGGGIGGAAGAAGKGLGGILTWVGIAGITVAAGQAIADAIGATPENPVSGASRAYYRNGRTMGSGLAGVGAAATGPVSGPYQRFTGYESIFGAHASDFALKMFRGSASGAIDLFDERIKYLAGAQGAGAGSKQYLSVVARDISALRNLLPGATDEQKAAITGEIKTLEGILASKKFTVSAESLAAINEPAKRTAKTDDIREANRIAKQTGAVTQSKIDYAKVEQVRATDAVADAVRTMNYDLQRAILGMSVSVQLTAASVSKAQAKVDSTQTTTTMNKGGFVVS